MESENKKKSESAKGKGRKIITERRANSGRFEHQNRDPHEGEQRHDPEQQHRRKHRPGGNPATDGGGVRSCRSGLRR